MHRPDLTGLQPVYRVHLARALRWVVIGAVALTGLAATHRLLNRPDGWDIGFSVAQVVVFAALLVQQFRLPDAVFVLEDGLVWQHAFDRRTVVPWPDVREVRSGWRGTGFAVLGNGRKLPLVAMPADDVRLLTNAVTACR